MTEKLVKELTKIQQQASGGYPFFICNAPSMIPNLWSNVTHACIVYSKELKILFIAMKDTTWYDDDLL
jgi:hypothetical protein